MEKRTKRIKRYIVMGILVFLGILLKQYLGGSWNLGLGKITASESEVKEKLDIPKFATKITTRSEQILEHQNYVVSFNSDWNVPNYVAWEINQSELKKNVQRENLFLPDPLLNPLVAVVSQDFSRSGYDRGHMCPAADNLFDKTAMQESFYMSNVCPQDHELNRGRWNDLEIKCREWTKEKGRLIMVCGPIFKSGKPSRYIGKNQKIGVPDSFFKVILSLDSHPANSIGIVFRNDNSQHPEKYYSIDQIEEMTGIDFFPDLEEEASIESQCDSIFWHF